MAQQRSDYPVDYTKRTEQTVKDHLRETADSAADQLKSFAGTAEQVAGQVGEQAREYAEKAQDAARNVKPFVQKSMKEQPMGTLAAAAVIGFVLGALWKK